MKDYIFNIDPKIKPLNIDKYTRESFCFRNQIIEDALNAEFQKCKLLYWIHSKVRNWCFRRAGLRLAETISGEYIEIWRRKRLIKKIQFSFETNFEGNNNDDPTKT